MSQVSGVQATVMRKFASSILSRPVRTNLARIWVNLDTIKVFWQIGFIDLLANLRAQRDAGGAQSGIRHSGHPGGGII